jgi:hypothetical protein
VDFTLDELKTLKVKQRYPFRDQQYNGMFISDFTFIIITTHEFIIIFYNVLSYLVILFICICIRQSIYCLPTADNHAVNANHLPIFLATSTYILICFYSLQNNIGTIAKTVQFGTLIVKMVHFLGLCKKGPLFPKQMLRQDHFLPSFRLVPFLN